MSRLQTVLTVCMRELDYTWQEAMIHEMVKNPQTVELRQLLRFKGVNKKLQYAAKHTVWKENADFSSGKAVKQADDISERIRLLGIPLCV